MDINKLTRLEESAQRVEKATTLMEYVSRTLYDLEALLPETRMYTQDIQVLIDLAIEQDGKAAKEIKKIVKKEASKAKEKP